MRRHPNHLIRNLLTATLIILAAMHPAVVSTLAELGAGVLLALVDGITRAAANQPEAALLTAGLIWIAHQIHTHRPRPARARA